MLTVDYINDAPNTPAADHWTLSFQYIFSNESMLSHDLQVVFLPTGEVDMTQTSAADWAMVNRILSPTIALIRLGGIAQGVDLDFWTLINWLFVSSYWSVLANLGQDRPTIYPPSPRSG